MEGEEDQVKKARIVEARARNISHNVRCTECGSQSIEDAQADIAILLRKLIRDEIRAGKYDKEIYKKLEEDFAETVLYSPRFDIQTAAIWLSLVIFRAAWGKKVQALHGESLFHMCVWLSYPHSCLVTILELSMRHLRPCLWILDLMEIH